MTTQAQKEQPSERSADVTLDLAFILARAVEMQAQSTSPDAIEQIDNWVNVMSDTVEFYPESEPAQAIRTERLALEAVRKAEKSDAAIAEAPVLSETTKDINFFSAQIAERVAQSHNWDIARSIGDSMKMGLFEIENAPDGEFAKNIRAARLQAEAIEAARPDTKVTIVPEVELTPMEQLRQQHRGATSIAERLKIGEQMQAITDANIVADRDTGRGV